MYDTILVPTDGSDHARRAAEHGLALAAAFDATVHVLAVVDAGAAGGLFGGGSDAVAERLETEAKSAIEAVESLADDAARERLVTATVEGRPAEAILEYAADEGADAIVMGTHGRTGLRRFVTGSVAEHVVRLADVPVMTVRATGESGAPGYERVLVPTDGSECAERAVDHALAIASAFDATLYALNVVDVGAITAYADASISMTVLDELRESGEEATAAIAERADAEGVEAKTAVLEGFPATDLLGYAEDHEIDLIAMGTHGRTGIGRFLLGSVTERTIRHAPMPVLSVRAEDEADEE